MAGATPAFYHLAMTPTRQGLLQEDLHRIIYDLFLGIYYLCNNIDDDAGTVDSDYASKLSDPLEACGTPSEVPLGSTTGTYFYTPSQKMDPNGMLMVDIYAAIYNISVALVMICAHLDADNGGNPDADYGSTIGDHLTATIGAQMAAPPEGLISGSVFYGMEGYMENGAFTMGDLYKCLYDLYIACVTICDMIDADGAIGTDYLATVGTPLNTAIGAFIRAPQGETETGS